MFGTKTKNVEFRIPAYPPSPPMPNIYQRVDAVNGVKKVYREFLLACLHGGMSYAEAKEVAASETAEEMELAIKADASNSEFNKKSAEEFKVAWARYESQRENYEAALSKR